MSKIAKYTPLAALAGRSCSPRHKLGSLATLPTYTSWHSWTVANRPQTFRWHSYILASRRTKAAQRRGITTYNNQGCKAANFKSGRGWRTCKDANLQTLAILICRGDLQEDCR